MSAWAKLSRNERRLATLLMLAIGCGILLSPIGFETRAPAFLRNGSPGWLGLGVVGFASNLAALLTLFLRPRWAPLLAAVGSMASVALFLADQAGLAISIRAPTAISLLEAIAGGFMVGNLVMALRAYTEARPSTWSVTEDARQ